MCAAGVGEGQPPHLLSWLCVLRDAHVRPQNKRRRTKLLRRPSKRSLMHDWLGGAATASKCVNEGSTSDRDNKGSTSDR